MLFCLLTTHTACPHIETSARYAPAQSIAYPIYEKDDLNKRSAKHANKSTLVARGTDTQLVSSCASAPLATNVDLWNPIIGINVKRFYCIKVCFGEIKSKS